MENSTLAVYREKLKKRLKWAIAYNFLVVLVIVFNRYLDNRFMIPDMSLGFTSGFVVGIQTLVIFGMFKINSAIQDDAKLKALYIKENDERTRAIQEKIGGVGINLIIAGLGLATVITCYIDMTIFLTILSVLFFAVMVKGALKVYYRKVL